MTRVRLTRTRAASTVEYALILVAVVLLAAGSFKLLGGKVGSRSGSAGDVVAGEGNGIKSKPGLAGDSPGAKTGSGDQSSTSSKSGSGGSNANGNQGGGVVSTRDTSSESNAVASVSNKDKGGNADVSDNFTPKRWMGIGLLAAGVIAIGYVVASMRRTKKEADAAGGGKDASRSNKPRRRRR